MTSINTSYQHTVPQQTIATTEPSPPKEISKSYDDAMGQFIADRLTEKERIPATPQEMQKRLEGWRAFLDQFLLDKSGSARNENGDYIDGDNEFRDKDGKLIDVGNWINNWLLQKRMSSVSI